jgi:hypothetical protein
MKLRTIVPILGVTLALAAGVPAGAAGAAGAAGGTTFTLKVSSSTVKAAKYFIKSHYSAATYSSVAEFIWSFACENDHGWSAPVPKLVSTNSSGNRYRIRLSAGQVKKANAALKHESCANSGIRSIEQDYKKTSTHSSVLQAISAVKLPSTAVTTTTSHSAPAATTTPTTHAASATTTTSRAAAPVTTTTRAPSPTTTAPPQTTVPPTTAPPTTTTTVAPAGCHPQTPSGGCYNAGELCSAAEHGEVGVAGNGAQITCENTDPGSTWHWVDS